MSFYDILQRDTQAERATLLAQPLFSDALAGRVTRSLYCAFLAEAYHHVRHTVPLMMTAGGRLPPDKEWLREKLVHYVEEEYGHHEWILDDIRASGGDAEAVRRSAPGFATELMVAYAYDTVQRGNPVGLLGMVHVLEGTSTALATQAAQSLAHALELPARAFTYLSSHGALDVSHVDFFRELVNRFEAPEDRAAVIHASRCFYRLYGDIFASLHRGTSACVW
jgi:pyrroloquinoline quinone (PQQ) biosynthesis protein C